jgi:hypothetical protein
MDCPFDICSVGEASARPAPRKGIDVRKAWIAALVLAAPHMAAAASLPAPTSQPCREQATGRALDFWVGDWTVTNADGTRAGQNRIERILDGCAIIEHWHGVDAGDDGMSLFSYDAARHIWEQVWVSEDTSRQGGLKHQKLTVILYANALRFEGQIVLRNGKTILERTTLTPWLDGRVRQTIEESKDGGKIWKIAFDAYYNRKGAPDLGARPGGDPH